MSQMLAELNLPPLQDRRKANRLTFFFKVVKGLVPAMQSHDYLTPIRGKRHIKSKQYTDCVTSYINLQTIVNVLSLSSAIDPFPIIGFYLYHVISADQSNNWTTSGI